MDCKELIERLRCPDDISKCEYLAKYNNSCVECANKALLDAADAIETLLAERDAAIKILREMNWCSGCIHFMGLKGCSDNSMNLCCKENDNYQFCVPQKGDE